MKSPSRSARFPRINSPISPARWTNALLIGQSQNQGPGIVQNVASA
jgi:hypothetical protein